MCSLFLTVDSGVPARVQPCLPVSVFSDLPACHCAASVVAKA